MSLKKQIEKKLTEALKAKDKSTYPTLRLIVSSIKDAEIAARTKDQKEMSDSDITVILKNLTKKRSFSNERMKSTTNLMEMTVCSIHHEARKILIHSHSIVVSVQCL